MLEFRLKENTTQGKLFAEFIKTLPFIEIINRDNNNKKTAKDELTADWKTSIKQANDMHSGKMKKRTFQDTLNEK